MSVDKPAEKVGRTTLSGVDDRWEGPDFARGAMLLMIAVANAPYWLPAVAPEDLGAADSAWVLIRTLLVDQREYPLFSLLIGFGCVVMVSRQVRRGSSVAEAAAFIRRRGLWLAAFGACHAVLFQGDVLGAYGIALALFSGPLARMGAQGRVTRSAWVASAISVAASAALLSYGGSVGADGSGSVADWHGDGLVAGLVGLVYWCLNTPLMLVGTTIVPCLLLGTALARSPWMRDPSQRLGGLALRGCALVALGMLGALPHALMRSGLLLGQEPWWTLPLHVLTGAAGALGLLMLLVALSSALRRLGRAVTVLGRMSLTGYLLQTALFGLCYWMLWQTGLMPVATPIWGLVIGTTVFAATLLTAHLLGRASRPGPADELLRRLVAGDHPAGEKKA